MNGPYLANKQTRIVHDLNNLKPECKISEIIPKIKQYFYPDQTIEEIVTQSYKRCQYCIG